MEHVPGKGVRRGAVKAVGLVPTTNHDGRCSAGKICTHRDCKGRTTYDLYPPQVMTEHASVGRLMCKSNTHNLQEVQNLHFLMRSRQYIATIGLAVGIGASKTKA